MDYLDEGLEIADLGRMGSPVLRWRSLGEQVASAIRREIILGRLKEGTVLPQEKLCETYDVSRIPVRDALLTLANEGFVTPNRRNQMTVTRFHPEDLLDSFRTNSYISALAADRAARSASPSDLEDLDHLIVEGEKLHPARDRIQMAQLSWDFHRKINRMARSTRLLAMLKAAGLPLLQDFMKDLPEWWDSTHDEHRQIAEALRRADSDSARTLTAAHFDHGRDTLAKFLEMHGKY